MTASGEFLSIGILARATVGVLVVLVECSDVAASQHNPLGPVSRQAEGSAHTLAAVKMDDRSSDCASVSIPGAMNNCF